ncbi:MAG: AmmeMemoRadiSam system radical SAM enzyme [Oscillospiraceae bacterium]|nr:AmmeMemoRadiSam system radical SAM enzyme [Oscillospiraceae bacterium]
MNEAQFYARADGKAVVCALCPHNCSINDGQAGICGVRQNKGGTLYAAGYGLVSSIALDPIEKKPLYMFHPGKNVLSIGGFGCNLHCPFCQNCEISLEYKSRWESAERLSPEKIVALAKYYVPERNIGIAYTYNEPFVGYEFVYDCAKLVCEAGLKNVLVTNGTISPEPLEKLLPYIDAMNIDLKGFTNRFYKNLGGDFEAVKETIKAAYKRCHIEITTLIIPGENDSDEEIASLAKWLASLDRAIFLHLTRFYPRHKYSDKAPTTQDTILRLREVAKKYLENV